MIFTVSRKIPSRFIKLINHEQFKTKIKIVSYQSASPMRPINSKTPSGLFDLQNTPIVRYHAR
jgi:hypothetical protein